MFFQDAASLGSWSASVGGVELVDPGIPLLDFPGRHGAAWDNQPAIRRVVGFIARQLAATSLHAYKVDTDGGRERVYDTRLAKFLRKPAVAPGQTAMRFWESMHIDRLLHDRMFAIHVYNKKTGEFEGLRRLPAHRAKAHGDDGVVELISYTRRDGQTVSFTPDECFFDVGYSVRNANGTSQLTTLAAILAESDAAVEYRRKLMANMAQVSSIIERAAGMKWTPESRKRFEADLRDFIRGGGREGGALLLEDGMTMKPIQAFAPKDVQDLEGRKLTDIEVATAYWIPPELLGLREGTHSNIAAFREMLFSVALGPDYVAWEQSVNDGLVPLLSPDGTEFAETNLESKLRGSFAEQSDVITRAVGGPTMTRNEGRKLRNLPPIPGGDELITPLNVAIGGQSSPLDGK